jgi:hypothetical protein
MSRNTRALKLVRPWVQKIGRSEAKKRLSDRKISLATADKIVRNDYPSTPGELITEILLEEMAKDGFSLADEKAS